MEPDCLFETDQESERWLIEQLARHHHETWGRDIGPLSPGRARRSVKSWFSIAEEIAKLQPRIDNGERAFVGGQLSFRILLLIWPKLMRLMPYTYEERQSVPTLTQTH